LGTWLTFLVARGPLSVERLHLLQEGKGKPFTFSCHGLIDYPKQYFLDAHKPHQGRYFYHFAVAMQKAAAARDAERQRAQEEAKTRAQQLVLPVISQEQEGAPQETAETLVPEQELPEQVHIETIDDEVEENGERNRDDSLVAFASMSTVVDELPIGEDDLGSVNHHGDDDTSERIEDVSSPVPLSGEELQPSQTTVVSSPGKRQRQGQKGFTTGTLVTAAVCLVVVVGLTIWWVASKR